MNWNGNKIWKSFESTLCLFISNIFLRRVVYNIVLNKGGGMSKTITGFQYRRLGVQLPPEESLRTGLRKPLVNTGYWAY